MFAVDKGKLRWRSSSARPIEQKHENTLLVTADWSSALRESIPQLYPIRPQHKMLCAEIGSFEGIGSLFLVNKLCGHPESRLYCIDHWKDTYGSEAEELRVYDKDFVGQYGRFLHNTRETPKIVPLQGVSDEMISHLPNSLDFAYIDGDHSPNQTYSDAVHIFPKMKKGGIILFDDYQFVSNGVRTQIGIDKFINEYAGRVQIILHGYQLAVRVL